MTNKIGNNIVDIQLGDITCSRVDALIVPQFTNCASYGGVGGAIARSGAEAGLQAFNDFIAEAGEQKFGTVLLTPSGGGSVPHLLHVVSVGSGEKDEFNTIKTAFFNALKVAEDNGIKSIAAPALGTGIIGSLTPQQSAEAMMSALKQYSEGGGKEISVQFVIYGDQHAHFAFNDVLKSQRYAEANDTQTGKQKPNAARWVTEMARDARANKTHFGKAGGPEPK